MSSTRFVILHHQQADGEHWDLMIEQGAVLATWRLHNDLLAQEDQVIAAERIGDHRKAYLDYEGPLSGGRGAVSRVEEGVCDILEATETRWRISLRGRHIAGSFELSVAPTDRWTLRCEEEGPSQDSTS